MSGDQRLDMIFFTYSEVQFEGMNTSDNGNDYCSQIPKKKLEIFETLYQTLNCFQIFFLKKMTILHHKITVIGYKMFNVTLDLSIHNCMSKAMNSLWFYYMPFKMWNK